MRGKKLLVAFLLGVGLCFVPVLGYGEIRPDLPITSLSFHLLEARVNYIMSKPTSFLNVRFHYDSDGSIGKITGLPQGVDTKSKIVLAIQDNRGVFSNKSAALLNVEFELALWSIYSFIELVATDIDTDVVALFLGKEGNLLGYFYQGNFYLWEK